MCDKKSGIFGFRKNANAFRAAAITIITLSLGVVFLTACSSPLRGASSEQAFQRAVDIGVISDVRTPVSDVRRPDLIQVAVGDISQTTNLWVLFDTSLHHDLRFERDDVRLLRRYVTVNQTFSKGDVLAVAEFDTRQVEAEIDVILLTISRQERAFQRDQDQHWRTLRELRADRDKMTGELELQTQNRRIQRQELIFRNLSRVNDRTLADLNKRLDELYEMLEGDKIIAPFDGVVVAERTLEIGSILRSGDVVFTIFAPSDLRFIVTGRIEAVRFGDVFTATMFNRNVDFEFRVISDPIATNTRLGTYEFVVEPVDMAALWDKINSMGLEYTDYRNLRFDGDIIDYELRNVLIIPNAALYFLDDAPYVLLYENGEVNLRFVEVGFRDNINVQVLSGLTEGQYVVRRR